MAVEEGQLKGDEQGGDQQQPEASEGRAHAVEGSPQNHHPETEGCGGGQQWDQANGEQVESSELGEQPVDQSAAAVGRVVNRAGVGEVVAKGEVTAAVASADEVPGDLSVLGFRGFQGVEKVPGREDDQESMSEEPQQHQGEGQQSPIEAPGFGRLRACAKATLHGRRV